MKIHYISNAGKFSGVGQWAEQVRKRLEGSARDIVDWRIDGEQGQLWRNAEMIDEIKGWAGVLGSKSVNWVRLGRKIPGEGAGMYHVTNQSLSFLVARLSPLVVTVHDIIEVTDPQNRKAVLLNRYLYSGIGKAERIIAVSDYVKRQVMEYYGVAEEKITVIHNGVDREVFYPLENVERDRRMILYVGSEHPRKNLKAVLEVMAALRKKWPEARLVKVGAAGFDFGRRETEQLIKELALGDAVEWREQVSAAELNELYNEAGVLLLPSYQEGFGLPVLEAFAAGCPVVCSNATSLPEVAGEAAFMHEPGDFEEMMQSVKKLLQDEPLRENMRQKGFAQAKKFSWDKAASQVLEVYKKLV